MPNMRSTYIRRRASSGSGRVYIQLSSYLILPHELIAAAAFFFFWQKGKAEKRIVFPGEGRRAVTHYPPLCLVTPLPARIDSTLNRPFIVSGSVGRVLSISFGLIA